DGAGQPGDDGVAVGRPGYARGRHEAQGPACGLRRPGRSSPARHARPGARGAGRLGALGGADDAAAHLAGRRGGPVHLHARRGSARTFALRPDRALRAGDAGAAGPAAASAAALTRRRRTSRRHCAWTAWISRFRAILSPTTVPPVSSGMSMSMPKSLRLMVVVASKAATGPWPMPGFTPM